MLLYNAASAVVYEDFYLLIQIFNRLRRGKVFLLAWQIPIPTGDMAKVFGLVKCDWFAFDHGGPWNWQVASSYMMAQGMLYRRGEFNPIKWRGLIDFENVQKIERYPRTDFDRIR
jgi:hypothetical protein